MAQKSRSRADRENHDNTPKALPVTIFSASAFPAFDCIEGEIARSSPAPGVCQLYDAGIFWSYYFTSQDSGIKFLRFNLIFYRKKMCDEESFLGNWCVG